MREVFCQRCQLTYAWWWQNCSRAGCVRQARPRAPQPTIEEEFAERRRALEAKFAEENRVRQREQDRLDLENAVGRTLVREVLACHDKQKLAEIPAKSAERKAAMEAARAGMKRRAQIGRLEQKLGDRAREQRAKDEARAKQLTDTLAAREHAQNSRRKAQRASDGKRGGR